MNEKFPIFNGFVQFKYKKYSWKWLVVLYSPIILTIPVLLMFLHPILFYIGLYIISTVIFYKKKAYWIALPSKGDFFYKKKIEYFTYIVNKTGEKKFNHFLHIRKLDRLTKLYHLLSEKEYFTEKKSNKKENFLYKLVKKLKNDRKNHKRNDT